MSSDDALLREMYAKLALILPITDTFSGLLPLPANRANRLLGFGPDGSVIATPGSTISGILVSAYMEGLLAAADAAAARSTLGAASSALVSQIETDLTALEGAALLRDGTQAPTANIPFGNFRLTGLGNGTAATDAVNKGQLDALPIQAVFESAPQTIVQGSTFVVAHGLGRRPVLVQCWLRCATANANYAVGDEIPFGTSGSGLVANSFQTQGWLNPYVANDTEIVVWMAGTAAQWLYPDKNTGGATALNLPSWRVIVRAI